MGLLLFEGVLFLVGIGLMIVGVVIDSRAVRSRDYLRFEERAVHAQRLTLASFAVLLVLVLIRYPLLGAALLVPVAAWMLWWLPASHRQIRVGAESVFDVAPEAVAAVMFDISQQPRWMSSVVSAGVETPGMLRKGSVVRQSIMLGGHELVARLLVTEFVPYERLVMTLQVRYGHSFDDFEVVPQGRGALVKYYAGHRLSRVNAILSGWRYPLLRGRFTRMRVENLERLRQLVTPVAIARQASG